MKREIIIAKVVQKLSFKLDQDVAKLILDEKRVPVLSAPRVLKTHFENNKSTAPQMISVLDYLVENGYNQRGPKHLEAIMLVSKIFRLNYKVKQQSSPSLKQ